MSSLSVRPLGGRPSGPVRCSRLTGAVSGASSAAATAARTLVTAPRPQLDPRPVGVGGRSHLASAEQWGPTDRSHRKLAHLGSYLARVWVPDPNGIPRCKSAVQ